MMRIFQNLKTCNTCTPANISKQTPAKAAHLQANTDLQENSRPFHSFACNCYPYTMFEYNTEKKIFFEYCAQECTTNRMGPQDPERASGQANNQISQADP